MEFERIFIHAGHSKTGSSYIQSSLALSMDMLAENGILYPMRTGAGRGPGLGRWSSGNVGQGSIDDLLPFVPSAVSASLLLSSEFLCERDLHSGNFGAFDAIDRLWEIDQNSRVSLLLFVRDPLEHAISCFQQAVKTTGHVGLLEGYLSDYDYPVLVRDFLTVAAERDATVQVQNYSRQRSSILTSVEEWIGLPRQSLVLPPIENINRSLSWPEIEVQMAFNKYLGQEAMNLIGKPLCNRLTDVRVVAPPLARDALARFLDRMSDLIATVNGLMPAEAALRLPHLDDAVRTYSGAQDLPPSLSREQLDVIAEAIASELASRDKIA